MRNFSLLSLVLALVWLLGACGGAPTGLGAVSAAGTESTVTEAAGGAAPRPADSAALRVLEQNNSDGYYYQDQAGVSPLLHYVDFATAQDLPLCANPNCTHKDDTCTAWADQGYMLGVAGERLILLCSGGTMDAPRPRIDQMALDGTGRRTLAQLDSGWTYASVGNPGMGVSWPALTDGEALYVPVEEWVQTISLDYTPKRDLLRVPFDGGESASLGLSLDSRDQILGASGRTLVISRTLVEPGVRDDVSAAPPKALVVLDLDTGTETTLYTAAAPLGQDTPVWVGEEACYVVDCATGDVLALPLDGAAGRTLANIGPLTLPGANRFDGMVNGRLSLLTPARSLDELGFTSDWQRTLIDTESGAVTISPLLRYDFSHYMPVPLLAITEDVVLVEYELRQQDTVMMGQDGNIFQKPDLAPLRALMTPQEFLAGDMTAYRDIAVLDGA